MIEICVTNLVPDLRSCVVKGAHRSNCDGFAKRYDPETKQTVSAYTIEWNPITRENDRWLTPCPGCLPRVVEKDAGGNAVGILCHAHVLKLEHALERDSDGRLVLVDLVTHMWSIDSGGVRDDNDRVSTAYGSQWPLSESHILANFVYMELAATAVAFAVDLKIDEPTWSAAATITDGFVVDLDVDIVGILVGRLVDWLAAHAPRAVKRKHSAEAVVRMIAVVQNALAKFPLVDLEHRVPFVRCPGCARMTMTWRPPLMAFDDVVIKCERCGHEETQDWLEHYIDAVKTDPRRRA